MSTAARDAFAKLKAAIDAIGEGRFTGRIDIADGTEEAPLARALERMALAVQERQLSVVHNEKMRAFAELGAGVTHEVKNPLTGIIGFAQVGAKKAEDSAKARELFKLIDEQAQRCQKVLVNFLEFARRRDVQKVELDLNAVVDESARVMSHQLGMTKVKLWLQLEPDLPPVLGHRDELQRVLLNLVLNAQQAMTDGGNVYLITEQSGKNTVFMRVKDDGPGIPPDIQHRVFEPFFTTKTSRQGSGLGLAICYGIVRHHGGVITLESAPGQGAMFSLELPVVGAPPLEQSAPEPKAAVVGSADDLARAMAPSAK
jgi:signal transduction histidine kinase